MSPETLLLLIELFVFTPPPMPEEELCDLLLALRHAYDEAEALHASARGGGILTPLPIIPHAPMQPCPWAPSLTALDWRYCRESPRSFAGRRPLRCRCALHNRRPSRWPRRSSGNP